ncbi:MAG: hypothetical protein KA714_23195 [Limnoraphis sp. WC205]|nr:hypothetical protein [Limnoraphis sp. WC205]
MMFCHRVIELGVAPNFRPLLTASDHIWPQAWQSIQVAIASIAELKAPVL